MAQSINAPFGFEMVYTTTTLKGAKQQMRGKDLRLADECFAHYREQWTAIASEEPLNVAFTVHEVTDEHVAHMLATSKHGPEVQCRKGCAACCHLYVDVFPQEAQLLLEFARDQGIEIDEARLARQATKTDATWHELPPEDQRCVFLGDDRACRVYEHRPGACRKYAVKNDPDLCDMHKHPGGRVAIVFSVEAEIIHSAAMTTYGAGSMAAMLLKAKG